MSRKWVRGKLVVEPNLIVFPIKIAPAEKALIASAVEKVNKLRAKEREAYWARPYDETKLGQRGMLEPVTSSSFSRETIVSTAKQILSASWPGPGTAVIPKRSSKRNTRATRSKGKTRRSRGKK